MSEESIKRQLKNLDIKKLKLKNGRTVSDELMRHARILADCIMEELDAVYDSYVPKIYERTYGLYNSLVIDPTVKMNVSANDTSLNVRLFFDNSAVHNSFNGEKVKVEVLLDQGWQTHGSFSGIPYLGFRSGTFFIEKGIERYKQVVSNPFSVKVNFYYN